MAWKSLTKRRSMACLTTSAKWWRTTRDVVHSTTCLVSETSTQACQTVSPNHQSNPRSRTRMTWDQLYLTNQKAFRSSLPRSMPSWMWLFRTSPSSSALLTESSKLVDLKTYYLLVSHSTLSSSQWNPRRSQSQSRCQPHLVSTTSNSHSSARRELPLANLWSSTSLSLRTLELCFKEAPIIDFSNLLKTRHYNHFSKIGQI